MIIDSHVHILPDFKGKIPYYVQTDKLYREFFGDTKAKTATANDLAQDMERCGVDVAVILGYGWEKIEAARLFNEYLLTAQENFSTKFISFCTVNPDWGEVAVYELEKNIKSGAKGLGELHFSADQLDIYAEHTKNSVFSEIMFLLKKHNLPCLLHVSEPVGHLYPGKGTAHPEKVLALIDKYPNNIFILAHFGGGLAFYTLMPEVRSTLKNSYIDSAAFPFLYNREIFKATSFSAGTDKILFGSDYPLIKFDRALREIDNCGLSISEKASILAINAAKLFNI